MDGIYSRLLSQRAQSNDTLNRVVEDSKIGLGIQIPGAVQERAVRSLWQVAQGRPALLIGDHSKQPQRNGNRA